MLVLSSTPLFFIVIPSTRPKIFSTGKILAQSDSSLQVVDKNFFFCYALSVIGSLDQIYKHICGKCGREFSSGQLVVEKEICSICSVKDISWIKNVEYTLIDTPIKYDKFEQFLSSFPEGHILGFDTETTGLFVKKSRLVGLSISWEDGKAVYLPFRHRTGDNLSVELILPRLLKLLKKFNLVFANGKFDTQVIYCESGQWLKVFADILIERVLDDSTVAQSERQKAHFGLKQTTKDLFKIDMIDFDETVQDFPTIDYVSPEAVRFYAPADADFSRRAHFRLMEKMQREKNPCLGGILDLELSLIPIIAKMELIGITVDVSYAESLVGPTKEKLLELEKRFFSILKEDYGYEGKVSLTSPPQIIDLFYNKLEIPKVYVYRKNKGIKEKTLTVGKEAFNQLGEKYPIVSVYHEFVTTKKLLRDFLENFGKKAVNGIMYCSIKQIGAETGRMSCVKVTSEVGVNMQQIPKKKDEKQGISVRKIFQARPGYVFLDIDLDQVELRLFAAESGAEKLLEDIVANRDLHKSTAATAYKISYDSVTDEQRSQAKSMNYALTYGGDAGTLARKNRIPRAHAEEMFNSFFEANPSAEKWMFDQIQFASTNKYILTRFGRKVRLLEDFRKANNYKIQSTMQDIFKIGVARADKAVQSLKQKYGEDAINTLLLVHDEILFEVKDNPEIIKESAKTIKEAMEPKIPGYCKIVASVSIGKNWADTEDYKDENEPIAPENNQEKICVKDSRVPTPEQAKNSTPENSALPVVATENSVSNEDTNAVKIENIKGDSESVLSTPDSSRIIICLMEDINNEALTRLRFMAQAHPGTVEVVVDKNKVRKTLPFKVSVHAFDRIKQLFPMPLANVVMYDGNRLVKI